MRLKRGIEKLAVINDKELVLNWHRFGYFEGHALSYFTQDRVIGRLIFGLGVVVIIAALIGLILGGKLARWQFYNPQTIYDLGIWFGIFLLVAGMFLRREQRLLTPARPTKIQQTWSKAKGSIDFTDIVDQNLFFILDRLSFRFSREFLTKFINLIIVSPKLQVLLTRLGVDSNDLKNNLNTYLVGIPQDFDAHYIGLFTLATQEAIFLHAVRVDEIACFFALAKTALQKYLLDKGILNEELTAMEIWMRNQYILEDYEKIWEQKSVLKPTGVVNRAYTSRYAPTLEQFGKDFTAKAATQGFDVTIGREQEMAEMLKILRKEHNPAVILLGEPGVGKSRMLQHLATRMVVEDVPAGLRDKRLVAFDLNQAFTETRTLESFKQTLQDLLEEVTKAGNIILVFEDFEQLLQIREDIKAEVVNIVIDGLKQSNVKLIATSTADGYQRMIRPIKQLAAIFEAIYVKEPSASMSMQILVDEVPRIESKYGVKIQVGGVRQVVQLAPKYAYERVMPDKAIDLLEECALEAHDQGLNYVTEDTVSTVVSKKIGVTVGNISQSEGEKLSNLEQEMHKRVIGQQEAIRAVAAALRRARAGLSKPGKPIASFLFFGPTGVGKTELAKTLAATYYGDEKFMVRVDMSEFQEERNLGRLIGELSANNEFSGGFLTEPIRTKPFSLVLIDEIEKANPKVLDLFLQILDEGQVTDGAGRLVNFKNTIIIATSNAGSREIADKLQSGASYEEVSRDSQTVLRTSFRVEFLNRFDKLIMFRPLLPVEIAQVTAKLLHAVQEHLLSQGIAFTYEEKLIDDLVNIGYSAVYGAREMARVIQENLEDKIADLIVRGELASGKKVHFDALDKHTVT